jgi:hypothetical protein
VGLRIAFSFVLLATLCRLSPAQDVPAYTATLRSNSAIVFAALQTHMPTKSGNVPNLHPTESTGPIVQPKIHLDPAQLQREAQELLSLSQSLQADIESVNRGLLPKDMAEKLKRIQKVAKHLRGEIAP